jgi:Methyltransferase domain
MSRLSALVRRWRWSREALNRTQPSAAPQPLLFARIRDIELRLFAGVDAPMSTEHVIHMHKTEDFVARLERTLLRVMPKRMVELGIFHGGSAIYWHDRLNPDHLSVLDIIPSAPPLESYIRRHHLESTFHPHLGVSQDDADTVRRLVREDMAGAAIDVVIDDASHMYAPTLASFECLFPMVRPGGAYIIEDWAWGHSRAWGDTWREFPLLSPLITEMMLACGSWEDAIDRIDVERYFAVVWRGGQPLPQDGSFRLKDHYIARDFALPRHTSSLMQQLTSKLRIGAQSR